MENAILPKIAQYQLTSWSWPYVCGRV